MGCSAPVSRRVPGSVMSMASAASAASLGPAPAGLFEQALDQFLEGLEALADGFLGLRRSGLEPAAGDIVEAALLAAQPVAGGRLPQRRAVEGGRIVRGLLCKRGKGLVERVVVEGGKIGNRVRSSCVLNPLRGFSLLWQ